MKITADSRTLARACAAACKNILGKPLLPIMSNIHFVVGNDNLRLTSTDNENWTVHNVPVTLSHIDEESLTAFCVEGRTITDFLLAVPSQPVTMEVKKNEYTGFYSVCVSHSAGKAEFPAASADEFPVVWPVETEGCPVPASLLKRVVQIHRFAVFNDFEVKPQLSSILLDFKGSSLVTVSTDGHRIVRLEHPGFEAEVSQVLLHPKCVALLIPMLDDVLADKESIGDVMIRADGTNICIQSGTATIYSRQSELRYPNYDSVIPSSKYTDKVAVIDRRDLIASVSRALLFADSASALVKFCFDPAGSVKLIGEDIDFSKLGEEKLACTFSGSAPFSIGFKGTFLKEMLSHMTSEQVRIEMTDPSRAAIVFEENGDKNLLMLLMPMFLP